MLRFDSHAITLKPESDARLRHETWQIDSNKLIFDFMSRAYTIIGNMRSFAFDRIE